MAEEVILGTDTLLFVDTELSLDTPNDEVPIPGDFKELICLSDNGFALSINPIDTSNKCVGLWATSLPGQRSGTFDASGDAVIIDLADERYNMDKIAALAASGQVVWFLQYNPNGTSVRYAKGYISSYNDQAPNQDKQTFSATVTLTGEISTSIATS